MAETSRLHEPIDNEPSTSQQADLCSERLPTVLPTAEEQLPTTNQKALVGRRSASNQKFSHIQRRPTSVFSAFLAKPLLHSILFLIAISLFMPRVQSRSVAVSSKCYFFGPGTTIHGADYRRDYDLNRKECAEQCKADSCCMAFEWLDGRCTLKSRSLNGTISALPEAYFGLCLDFEDTERERFWDHELGGSVVGSKEKVDRETCQKFCTFQEDAMIYSWSVHDEKDPDGFGDCQCIGVLHSVRLSFGSAAGFLI
ncbi:hypothetical protein M3Y97_00494900 [Aphelenchoides bicaudatus]|nr:hypothetical protein M3Y97_00494900 [Aphelenchoides bicaudatus]